MTEFYLAAAAVTVLALMLLAYPVAARRNDSADTERRRQNVAIYKEKLAVLQRQHDSGQLDDDEFSRQKTDLDRELLANADGPAAAGGRLGSGSAAKLLLAGIIAGLGSFIYLQTGSPHVIGRDTTPPPAAAAQPAAPEVPDINAMVQKLAERLQQEPDNGKGWHMLGKSYLVMGEYEQAVTAYARARALLPDDVTVLVESAQSLAQANENLLSGEPERLIDKALALDANHPQALWFKGLAQFQQEQHEAAIATWNKLIALVDGDSAQLVRQYLAQAYQQIGKPMPAALSAPPADSGPAITVQVDISKELRAALKGNETVFVFAKAVQGPPMPLAAHRTTVAALPLQITLTDEDAMTPAMSLSSFDKVTVGARVSLSGNPIPQAGDFQGLSGTLSNTAKDVVSVLIDQTL